MFRKKYRKRVVKRTREAPEIVIAMEEPWKPSRVVEVHPQVEDEFQKPLEFEKSCKGYVAWPWGYNCTTVHNTTVHVERKCRTKDCGSLVSFNRKNRHIVGRLPHLWHMIHNVSA